jgi:6-phosphofructokinase 2
MKKIITITLNPSLDKGTTVNGIMPEKKLQCSNPILEAGGGGINVSRALQHLGCHSTAIYMYGGYTGDKLNVLMQESGVECVAFNIAADTRENLIVVDTIVNKQYRFGMKGAELTKEEWQNPLTYLEENTGYEYVVASGSLPPGVPLDFFGRVAAIVQKKGAKLIIDTSGEALQHAVNEGVFLIKPNLAELSYLNGREELKEDDIIEAARNIVTNRGSEVVVVSMGGEGAMLITKEETIKLASPSVKLKSTVGAGDSMVAGLILGITRKYDWKNTLKLGIACGSAATMNEGTALCNKNDVDYLYSQM